MRVAVAGGGICGLSAAWELASQGADVSVYEPGPLGGKIRTSFFLDRAVDEGPDALLARVPDGVALCQELGLGDDLVAPAASKAMLYIGGHLRELPEGLVLGAPARLGPLARSGILSPLGLVRAAVDLVLPATGVGTDESVFDIVARRFGREVADRLIEPLVGSIYAGSTRELSAATAAPQLLRAANQGRSLLMSLRSSGHSVGRPAGAARPSGGAGPSVTGGRSGTSAASGTGAGPAFVAPAGGLGAMTEALVRRLGQMGTSFFDEEVVSVSAGPKGLGPVVVKTAAASATYDAAVLGVPAGAAARLLANVVSARACEYLSSMALSSVAIVTLGLTAGALPLPDGVSGVLVGPEAGTFTTAVSFGSRKWPHWCAPGQEVVRVSMGKINDQRWMRLTDEELVSKARTELATILSCMVPDLVEGGWRVSRWPRALPQYPVGHLEQVARIRDELRKSAPVLTVAGAGFGRVGIPANIAAGRAAAKSIVDFIASSVR